MEINYEIERKFLVSFPDTDRLNVRKKISIIQTYLNDGENGEQRRVRKMDVNGTVSYTYTEKVFVSAVTREENERSIDCDEYNLLVKQAKVDLKPVIKTRFVFEYKNQFFELDTYPFSDSLAVMELELENEEQEIFLPDYINVIKEITGDKQYSNISLALAEKFPDDETGDLV